MALLRRNLTALLLTVALTGPTVVPASAAPPAVPARTFTVIAAGDADWADFGVIDGADFVPLKPARQARSAPLPFSGGEVIFGRRVTDPDTGRSVNLPLARAPWPDGAAQSLFVLVPRARNGGGETLEVLACDDGPEAFPSESLRVINATQATFQGLVGRGRADFAPGSSAPVPTTAYIPLDEDAPDPGMPVRLALATPDSGLKALYAANHSVAPRARVLVLISPPRKPGSMRLQVRAIHDLPPVLTADAAKP